MPLPASWTTVTVTGTYTRRDGTPAAGSVEFISPQVVVVDGETVVPHTIAAALDDTGSLSVDLPATDDPDISPTGWTYTVNERGVRGLHRDTYAIQVPHDSAGIDLATVAPADAVDEVTDLVTTDTPQTITARKTFRPPDVNTTAISIEALASQVADLLVMRNASGQRTGYFNEHGEIRSIASADNTVAARFKRRSPAATANIAEFADIDNTVLGGFGPAGEVIAPNMPTLVQLDADVVEDAGDFTPLTDLGLNIDEPGTYRFQWTLAYSAGSTDTGVRLELDGPAFNSVYVAFLVAIASGGYFNQTRFDYSSFAASTVNQVDREFPIWIDGLILATEGGTLTPRFRTHDAVAGAVTVHAGSFGVLTSP